ncbi:MAG TPA: DUF692 domain-containing protein, partial [Polyangiaceae bacterium]|nr:DUF692 domain-containing protein [Polyangiaceae bacterium]
HSDHLCFSTAGPLVLHDLLPLKLCDENVRRVSDRLRWIQDDLKLPMSMENISYYAQPGKPEMPEAEFISEILERSGCGLLLDVNNVWVNAQNHGFSPEEFIESLPLSRVTQLHIAGHWRSESGLIIDTHGAPVIDPVIELLDFTVRRTGPVPVLLERDNEVPALSILLEEVAALQLAYDRALARREDERAGAA